MAYVTVPKDLGRVRNKVIFNLTLRQIVCIGTAVAVGAPFYFLTKGWLGVSNAATGMVVLMLPAFFFALYEKDGLPLEKVLMYMARVKFLRPGRRAYERRIPGMRAKQSKDRRKESGRTTDLEVLQDKQEVDGMMEHLENGSEPRAENETEDVKPEELVIGDFEAPEVFFDGKEGIEEADGKRLMPNMRDDPSGDGGERQPKEGMAGDSLEEAQPSDEAGMDAPIAGQDQDKVKEAEGSETGETDSAPPWTSHEDYLDSLLNGM